VADQEKKMRQISEVAADPKASVSEYLGKTKTREQQIPIIDALTNNVEGRFQVNVPNRGTIAGIPDDVVVESQAIIDASGVHQLKPTPLPRKIMLEQVLPRWLEMECNVEAYRSRDVSMLFWNSLTGHQTRTYEQAVETFQDVLNMPEHAELRSAYKGFTGTGTEWDAPTPAKEPSRVG